ncbi:hypothetical protein [Thiopseudomonas alkaliphila]|uniref:hypothetical protein n=1 Tax=Thiopseudomonas alkaliphila TaxID=1697053 RepID=UPI0039DF9C81
MGSEEVRQVLSSLVNGKHVAKNTQKVVLNALVFYIINLYSNLWVMLLSFCSF